MDDILILDARNRFHQSLIESGMWVVDSIGVPSNADVGDRSKAKQGKYNVSTLIAQRMASIVGVPQVMEPKKKGTSAGVKFEDLTAQFIRDTFPHLQHLRPGSWTVLSLGNQSATKASSFAQYEHLEYLMELVNTNSKLMTVLGNDYVVAPDIVVYRGLYEDEEINIDRRYINDNICKMSSLRKKNASLYYMPLFQLNGRCAATEHKIAERKPSISSGTGRAIFPTSWSLQMNRFHHGLPLLLWVQVMWTVCIIVPFMSCKMQSGSLVRNMAGMTL